MFLVDLFFYVCGYFFKRRRARKLSLSDQHYDLTLEEIEAFYPNKLY